MDILNPSTLPLALALAVLVERLWEYFAKPITDRAPAGWQPILNRYGPAIIAVLIVTLPRINALDPAIPGPLGIALTGLLIGGGSNLIHDITQR